MNTELRNLQLHKLPITFSGGSRSLQRRAKHTLIYPLFPFPSRRFIKQSCFSFSLSMTFLSFQVFEDLFRWGL